MNIKYALMALLAASIGNAYAERIDLKLVGQQGDHYFFTVPKSHILDKQFLMRSAQGFCGNKTFCYTHYWEAGKASPTKFPLTDKEARTEVASYVSNQRTGKKQMLWKCTLFPGVSKDECFS